jgi:AraC family transcriptional regulator of arabinose operon
VRAETPYSLPEGGFYADRFRFPAGLFTWRPRGTPDCLLMATLDGRGRVVHERGEVEVVRGDIVLLLPDAPHDYGTAAPEGWDVQFSHFPAEERRFELMRWPGLSPGIRLLRAAKAPEFAAIADALRLAAEELRSPRPHALELATNALDRALLLCDGVNPERTAIDARVRAAMAFVCTRLDQPLRLADVARSAGISASRLARLFRAQTGASIQEYVEAQRLALARQRLALTDQPIQDIAASLGFANAFYFSRRFTRSAGMSPRAFREKSRG